VKLYFDEADSPVLLRHAANGAKRVTGEITRMELWAALRRKEADGDLLEGGARNRLQRFDQDVATGRVTVLARDVTMGAEFESVIDKCFGADPQIHLRTLDAIHLASARLSGESEFVTTDRRLREAALMFGFTVFPGEPVGPPAPSV
jgi:predicted nucleic acid-binding protein